MTIRDQIEQMLRRQRWTTKELSGLLNIRESDVHKRIGEIRDYCDVQSAVVIRHRRAGERGRNRRMYWVEA